MRKIFILENIMRDSGTVQPSIHLKFIMLSSQGKTLNDCMTTRSRFVRKYGSSPFPPIHCEIDSNPFGEYFFRILGFWIISTDIWLSGALSCLASDSWYRRPHSFAAHGGRQRYFSVTARSRRWAWSLHAQKNIGPLKLILFNYLFIYRSIYFFIFYPLNSPNWFIFPQSVFRAVVMRSPLHALLISLVFPQNCFSLSLSLSRNYRHLFLVLLCHPPFEL